MNTNDEHKQPYVFFIWIFSACRFLLYSLALQHAMHQTIRHIVNITSILAQISKLHHWELHIKFYIKIYYSV